jgi:F-type H+-transporting ATPase subunit c
MTGVSEFIHYGTVALTIGINSIGVGLGQGYASKGALEAIDLQPAARNDIFRTAMLGIALIETAAIMGFIIAIILLASTRVALTTFYADIATIGIALAICSTGIVLGIASALPVHASCLAIARQPFFIRKIIGFMIMTQALIQTPIIAGLIIALFIRNQALLSNSLNDSLRLISCGACIGLGSIGPAIGLAIFAKQACGGLGINRKAYQKLLSFTLISEVIIETPIIFSFVISLTLLFITPAKEASLAQGVAYLAAALAISLGTLGAGISSGRVAAAAGKQIAHNINTHSYLSRITLLSQGLIETCVIYATIVAFILILICK